MAWPRQIPYVFHGVVGVHVQVAAALDLQVAQAVPGQGVEHVIEKAEAGVGAALAAAVEVLAATRSRSQSSGAQSAPCVALRSWCGLLLADADGSRVGLKALGLRHADDVLGRVGQALGGVGDDARRLDEIGPAQRRGVAGRALGRQHVVGAGEVIADRLGGRRAEEQRAAVANGIHPAPRVGHLQFGVFRR